MSRDPSIRGYAEAWAFRWLSAARPGVYVVTVDVPGFHIQNFAAVVDDFGNLVEIPE